MSECRLLQLSPAHQAFERVLQTINFGEPREICIRDSEPIIYTDSVVILNVKLDKEDVPRPELDLSDFSLGYSCFWLVR